MSRKTQAELIKELSDQQVTVQLVLTQLVILCLAVIGSALLFDSFWNDWSQQLTLNGQEWLVYGVLPGLIVLFIDFSLMYFLPERFYDDGGINDKVFRNRSIPSIFGVVLLVALSEEMLFRGVLHTEFGYIAASVLFAVMHIRYLTRLVLFVSVLFVSFFIGYMFELTESLIVTITAHFIIDVILALYIRFGNGEFK
ncbi:CPBP family intramembrane glutamic endopeptidase [Halobacillus litoralis]|uniref:CPBP family intramembrane glutamic endopeptidase n=1 Tax=Halobacillus litoralis TaxID=45668 RepID=UPI001CFE83CB|nr:CPBP family intramembrane glutamic endopeptidase [Halobacillus litoralis]